MNTERGPVVEFYMRGVDRTLLRENLKLTFEQRVRKHQSALEMAQELRRTGKKDLAGMKVITEATIHASAQASR